MLVIVDANITISILISSSRKQDLLFSDTLNHMAVLDELDTKNVPETYQVTGLTNVYQTNNDQNATLSQHDALANAVAVENGKIAIKAVFDR